MIQRNNNLSVLPFYKNLNEQNHRKRYAYGSIYPLYTSLGSIPPFQCIIPHTAKVIDSVTLFAGSQLDAQSVLVGDDITSQMVTAGLVKQNYVSDGYDILLFPSIAPMNITTKEGRYFISILLQDSSTHEIETWYSDVFTVVADVSGMIQVFWYDYQDLVMDGCRISYNGGYKNQLWLPTLLGKPDYEFNEEGEQRDGYFFPELQISEKRYKFNFLAPEYLCDVMRFIRLSDVVIVRDNYGNDYRADTFLINPKWQEQGDLASVDCEFTCDTVAKKIANPTNYGSEGDYNNDYNNDYLISD